MLIEESTLQDIPQNVENLLLSLVEAFPVPDRNDVMCVQHARRAIEEEKEMIKEL